MEIINTERSKNLLKLLLKGSKAGVNSYFIWDLIPNANGKSYSEVFWYERYVLNRLVGCIEV